jgi:hypothetical protein
MLFSNRREHMRQYVKIAGRGNVEAAWTPLSDMLHLTCKFCNYVWVTKEPADSTEIDSSVQDWVKAHAHGGQAVPLKPQWGDKMPWGQPAAAQMSPSSQSLLAKMEAEKQKEIELDIQKQKFQNEIRLKKLQLEAELAALDWKPKPKDEALVVKTGRKFR